MSSIAVWMTLPSYEACLRYLAEQHRLRCEGRPFIVVTHPCFREESYSSFKTQFNNEDYLQNGSSFGVEVFDRDKAIQFVDYHWNLSTMLKQSREVGFRMLALAVLPDAPGDNPGCALNSIKRSRRGTSNTYRPASIDRSNGHPQFIMDALGRANPAPI